MKSCDKKSEKQITKKDVSIAKNYLDEDEIETLGLIVEQFFAFAESMAKAKTLMKMTDWIEQLDLILQMNRKEILTHHGKISHDLALKKSAIEYDKFKKDGREIEKKKVSKS